MDHYSRPSLSRVKFLLLEALTSNHSSFGSLFFAFLLLREELMRWLRVFSAATKE